MAKINPVDDTITAISTPIGEGGIGIVRISGKNAFLVADKIFKAKDGKLPSQAKTFTLHYGFIVDPRTQVPLDDRDGPGVVDEVLLSVMRAPKTYTKEDVVEINCHGGIVSLKKILELILSCGARLAEPGEFTKRAFLNGRIDLAQAEAVLDAIRAKTEGGLKAAINQLEGSLSQEIAKLRDRIINILVDVEASIDFPDEDIKTIGESELFENLKNIMTDLEKLIHTADSGMILREGVLTVICGKPNVGKSSLLNALTRKDRAIVTPIPGTTRDVIEEYINVKGVPIRIADTAGITRFEHPLIKEGVQRSKKYMSSADLVLFVLDGSNLLTKEDLSILEDIKDKKTIVVVNKMDLPQQISLDLIYHTFGEDRVVKISAREKIGLDELENKVSKMIWDGHVVRSGEASLTNIRQKDVVVRAYESIRNAKSEVERSSSLEFVAPDLRDALDALGEIVGETATEEIINRIFENFCIGK